MQTPSTFYTVLVAYINTMNITFNFNLLFLPNSKIQHGYTHKHGINEKLSINIFSLFTCKLMYLKKACWNLSLKIENRLHCIEINSDRGRNRPPPSPKKTQLVGGPQGPNYVIKYRSKFPILRIGSFCLGRESAINRTFKPLYKIQ